jgi:hypothetical protein
MYAPHFNSIYRLVGLGGHLLPSRQASEVLLSQAQCRGVTVQVFQIRPEPTGTVPGPYRGTVTASESPWHRGTLPGWQRDSSRGDHRIAPAAGPGLDATVTVTAVGMPVTRTRCSPPGTLQCRAGPGGRAAGGSGPELPRSRAELGSPGPGPSNRRRP